MRIQNALKMQSRLELVKSDLWSLEWEMKGMDLDVDDDNDNEHTEWETREAREAREAWEREFQRISTLT